MWGWAEVNQAVSGWFAQLAGTDAPFLWLALMAATIAAVVTLIVKALEAALGRKIESVVEVLLAGHKALLAAAFLSVSATMLAQGWWRLAIGLLAALILIAYAVIHWRRIGDSFRFQGKFVPLRIIVALLSPVLPVALLAADISTRPEPKALVVVLPPLPDNQTGAIDVEPPEALRNVVDRAIRDAIRWAWSRDTTVTFHNASNWQGLGLSYSVDPSGLPDTLRSVGANGRVIYVAAPVMAFTDRDVTIYRRSFLLNPDNRFVRTASRKHAGTFSSKWNRLAAALAGIAFSSDALSDGAGSQLNDADKSAFAATNEDTLFNLVDEGEEGPIKACMLRQFPGEPAPDANSERRACSTLQCLSELGASLTSILDHDSEKGLPPAAVATSVSPDMGLSIPIPTSAPECGNVDTP